VENLDAMNGGVVGVFIAPTTKHDRWWRLSVVWCIGQSGASAWACLTSVRAGAHLMRPQVAVGVEVAVAPLLHRTVRCTPDMSGEL
jgi:hypothetical protein